MLGNFIWEHSFKLVPLGLELGDFALKKINARIRHLLQVVSVDIVRATLEAIQLLREVLGCVVHFNLQMVVFFSVHFE